MVHGLAMDGRQWRKVIAELPGRRCLTPVLPLGAHRIPMRADADLSLRGLGRLVAEFLEALDLRDVTLCFNDWCGAQVMIADGLMDRVGRLVLVSCEAYDNYPPGLAGHAAWLSAKLPGGMSVMRQVLLRRPLRNLPFVFGQMTKHGVPDELMREWLEPLKRRRDPPRRRQVHGGVDEGPARPCRGHRRAAGLRQAGARRLGPRRAR